jgi:TetR/AcrR family transcriptional regulator
MTAPTVPRNERRKERTAKAILGAAEREFTAHGFHDTRIDDIAARADVAVGSVYVHFGSKEGLYLALLERAFEVEQTYMATALEAGAEPLERLLAAGDAYLRFYRDHPDYFRILVFPHTDIPPDTDLPEPFQRLAARAERQIERFAGLIDQAVKSGSARRVNPYRAAKFLWGAWSGVIALNLRPDRLRVDDAELEAVLAEGRSMLIEGVQQAIGGTDEGRKK